MPTKLTSTGSELALLTQYLDQQREAVLVKTEGLARDQLAQRHPPSTLTLGGLLNHLALVEDCWLHERFLGLPGRCLRLQPPGPTGLREVRLQP